jgi:hypothetical protein
MFYRKRHLSKKKPQLENCGLDYYFMMLTQKKDK